MAHSQLKHVDTVIVGNGPSALILSYILHGHIPYYAGGHNDASLHAALRKSRNLLDVPLGALAAVGTSLKYSSQALPINILLDTLLRPGGDTLGATKSCVEWRHEPDKAVEHIVIGDAPKAGGQWASNPVETSSDIGTLSYAEQLSLPGYTIADFWQQHKGTKLAELTRPTRAEVADYFAAYPEMTGIANSMQYAAHIRGVHRIPHGFIISSHHIQCKRLVLASGIYTVNKPPPPLLTSLTLLGGTWKGPVLVIGSGFTAADIIMSTPPDRKILHIYNWDPDKRPSPLKACHPAAYPEYAAIYLMMKASAERLLNFPWKSSKQAAEKLISENAATLPASLTKRTWTTFYEGLPNARIMATGPDKDLAPANSNGDAEDKGRRRSLFPHFSRRGSVDAASAARDYSTWRSASVDTSAQVIPPGMPDLGTKAATLRIGYSSIGESIGRTVSEFRYATGRTGSLAYLSPILLHDILPTERSLSLQTDDQDVFRSPAGQSPQSPSNRASLEASPSLSGGRRPSESDLHDFATETKVRKAVVTASTLRDKIEEPFVQHSNDASGKLSVDYHRLSTESHGMMEVANNVFVVGSLTGDSLVRFAYGGCCAVAGRLMQDAGHKLEKGDELPAEDAASAEAVGLHKMKTQEEKHIEMAPDVAMSVSHPRQPNANSSQIDGNPTVKQAAGVHGEAETSTEKRPRSRSRRARNKLYGRQKGEETERKCVLQ